MTRLSWDHNGDALCGMDDSFNAGDVVLVWLACLQLEEDFVKANPEWVKELEIMVTTKVKAEIQALSSFGFQYLSQQYLPLKLQVKLLLRVYGEVLFTSKVCM